MKSEICKTCCPSGGALFDQMVPLYDDDFNVIRYGKQCRNCGEFKDYRKSPAKVIAKRERQARTDGSIHGAVRSGRTLSMIRRYYADVRVPRAKSHTGEARDIRVHIVIEGSSAVDCTQKAADVGFSTGLCLIGPIGY